VSKLDIAQRTFVSARTGGPGGLQGGYDVALAMREGRMDEVYGKVEETLRDMMGGEIVTLEQAAVDPRAAAQMARQTQMLTTGPLAIAGSEGEACRVLDAFAKGETGVGKEVIGETPEMASVKAITRGNTIQERQASILTDIHNVLAHKKVYVSEEARAEVQERAGLGAFGAREEGRIAERLRNKREAAETLAGQISPVAGGNLERYTRSEQREITKNELLGLVEPTKQAVQGISDKVKEVFTGRAGEEEGGPRTPEDINKRAAGEVTRGARFTAEAEQRAAREDTRSGKKESTVIIKVMSEEGVRQIVRVVLDERGEIIRTEDASANHGSTHGRRP
jgi:hypothetical protein